jgi:hypothetical protein
MTTKKCRITFSFLHFFVLVGSDADSDPAFHFDANLDPDPSFNYDAESDGSGSKS